MNPEAPAEERNCGSCGISEREHLELYGTPLGLLNFTFVTDQGPAFRGQVRLCRPCTHEHLPRRLLHAAGIAEEALPPEIWT